MTPISIIRHRERRSKCSLTPLEGGQTLAITRRVMAGADVRFTVLTLGAKELSANDAGRPPLLLDSTAFITPVRGMPAR